MSPGGQDVPNGCAHPQNEVTQRLEHRSRSVEIDYRQHSLAIFQTTVQITDIIMGRSKLHTPMYRMQPAMRYQNIS
jgi:hypothetical protein